MRVERLQSIPVELVDGFYALYVDAFEPLRVLAAARHVLTLAEFAEEMAVAFDICAHDDTVQHLSRGIERAIGAACDITVQAPDVQTCYEVEIHGAEAA